MREFEAKPPLRVRVRNNYNRVHSQIDPTNSLLTPELLSKNSMETNFWLSSALGYRGVGCPQGGGVMLDLLPHERRREVGSSSILYPTQELMQGHNQEGRGSSATCYPNPMSKNYECGIKLRSLL